MNENPLPSDAFVLGSRLSFLVQSTQTWCVDSSGLLAHGDGRDVQIFMLFPLFPYHSLTF